jgi:hypothetical protein
MHCIPNKNGPIQFQSTSYIIICMEQVTVVFFSSIFPIKHLLLTDSNPHGIPTKNKKEIAPSKKVQQNCKTNQMLSKTYVSYTPIINIVSSIPNTYNLTKPLQNKLYEVNILTLNKILLWKLGKLLILNCKMEMRYPSYFNHYCLHFCFFSPTCYQCLINDLVKY